MGEERGDTDSRGSDEKDRGPKMMYEVIVKSKGGPEHIQENLLDGIVPPHVVDLMTVESADDLGLCKLCDCGGARCHVLVWYAQNSYLKYCPVLWHDAFKPASWKVADLV